jgi:phosphoenolpyruvate carboxykinase (ATP)
VNRDYGLPYKTPLSVHGLNNLNKVFWNLSAAELIEHIIHNNEGQISSDGAVAVSTGMHTGRSPLDKYLVTHPDIRNDSSIWWDKVNHPLSPQSFDRLYNRISGYFQNRNAYVQDLRVGAHHSFTLPIRVITETAWHSLFAQNLFIPLSSDQITEHVPQFTVIHAPGCNAIPSEDGTNSSTFIALDLVRHIILIGGTEYAGEIKKAIFSVMNYILPRQGILSMHCSANIGEKMDTALFFGLSGTGKTTLSSDPNRSLIGDDEHGWCNDGIFNFEGGCYAKTIHLQSELEPLIWKASVQFGSLLENVTLNEYTRAPQFEDSSLTENCRSAYPIRFIPNAHLAGSSGHPKNIFFLSADAFGVLPPIACLTPEQAMYYYLSGYTAKLAGTESGLSTEPTATFSTCFAAPFLALQPNMYASLLGERISRYKTKVWLINTGWTGGPYGIGIRLQLPHTRTLINDALNGSLDNVPMRIDPYFGFSVPLTAPGVPENILDPRKTWQDSQEYDKKAAELVAEFKKNFTDFAGKTSPEVASAGPA